MTHFQDTAYDSVRRFAIVLVAAALALTTAPFLVGDAEADHLDQGTGIGPGNIDYDQNEEEGEEDDNLINSLRFFGEDRFDTAELIATDETVARPDFDGDTILVARADIFPDALAGSGLGGATRGPIVLTPNNTDADNGELNDDLQEAIDFYEETLETVYILGSTEAIAEDVEQAIADEVGDDVEIERVGGVNRFETAKLISDELEELGFDYDNAIVANGGNFPDALVAGALSAAEFFPILLTGSSGPLDPFAEEALEEVDTAFIAGGTDAIAQETEEDIDEVVDETRRVAGADRFETAVEFAELEINEFNFDDDHFNLARADDFPDALALGPHAGLDLATSSGGPRMNPEPGMGGRACNNMASETGTAMMSETATARCDAAPILLTATDDFSEQTEDFFNSFDSCNSPLHVAGGPAAISQEVEDDAREALTDEDGVCTINLTPQSATNMVGETHTVTATLQSETGDEPEFDETVTVLFETETESGTAMPMPDSGSDTVGPDDNEATFTFTSQTPGTVTIFASVMNADDETITATATKTFVADGDTESTTARAATGGASSSSGGLAKVAAATVPKSGG